MRAHCTDEFIWGGSISGELQRPTPYVRIYPRWGVKKVMIILPGGFFSYRVGKLIFIFHSLQSTDARMARKVTGKGNETHIGMKHITAALSDWKGTLLNVSIIDLDADHCHQQIIFWEIFAEQNKTYSGRILANWVVERLDQCNLSNRLNVCHTYEFV